MHFGGLQKFRLFLSVLIQKVSRDLTSHDALVEAHRNLDYPSSPRGKPGDKEVEIRCAWKRLSESRWG